MYAFIDFKKMAIEERKEMYLRISKIINKIEEYYIIITVMCYVVCGIAPVVAMIKYTPLYSYQRYLGIIGIFLIIIDIIVNKTIYKEKHGLCLYLLLLVASISSIITIRYGIKENVFNLAWTLIMFFLFYNFALKCDEKRFRNICRNLYYIVSVIWLLAIIFSIFSFVYNVGYDLVTNPYIPESLTRQGFLENRLFGVFMSVNVAAIMAGILLIVSVYMIHKKQSIWTKIFCFTNIVFDIIYIILSGSRSAYYGLLFISMIYAVYAIYSYLKLRKSVIVKWPLSLFGSIVSVICIMIAVSVAKNVLETVPKFSIFENKKIVYEQFIEKLPYTEMPEKESLSEEEIDGEIAVESESLHRKDISEENISNNRFKIWGDYLSLYKEIGLIGLSPCNYSDVIAENNPDIYIVKHIKDFYPNLYEAGNIYHPHSLYLEVYVASGAIGIVCFLIFWILGLKDVMMYLKYCKGKMPSVIVMGVLIIIYGLFTSIFDQGLFFLTNIVSCVFWIVLGYVMETITKNEISKN